MDLLRGIKHDKGDASESLAWQGTALSFLVAVILWFDLLSCASTNSPPRMPYQELLDNNLIDMSTTMGVQNTVMRSIGDIATLSIGNDLVRSATEPSFLTKCGAIEKSLRQYLDALEPDSPIVESATDNRAGPGHLEKVRLVTRVFATAALVQMYTIVPGYKPDTQTIHESIEDNIAAIRSIRDPQDIRCLVWPICISGSLAIKSKQREFYERTLKSALNRATRDFGNCATLLQILQWCWNSKGENSLAHDGKDWRHAMADIGSCLLV